MIFRILVLQLLFAAQFSIGTKFTGIVIGREKGNEHENFLETQDNADAKSSTQKPSCHPSSNPTKASTNKPSYTATKSPSKKPSSLPSAKSTFNPSKTLKPIFPSIKPTLKPTFHQSSAPRIPSQIPTQNPTHNPTHVPSQRSSISFRPSRRPSLQSTPSPTIPNLLTYHNGTVAVKPLNLYNIYFGKFDAPTMNLMDFLGATIGSSRYFSTVSAYYQVDSHGHRQYAASNVSFVKRAIYNKGAFNTIISSEQDFYDVVSTLITRQQLPLDTNGLYVVMYNGGFTVDGWNNLSNTHNILCGSHMTFDYSDTITLNIAVIGNPQVTSSNLFGSCTFPHWPNNLPGADSMASMYAFALAGTATDGHFDGWLSDSNGEEIASLCFGQFGRLFPPVHNTVNNSSSAQVTPTPTPTSTPVIWPTSSNLADIPIGSYNFDRLWNVKLSNGSTTKYFALQMLYLNGYGCVNEPPEQSTIKSSVRPSFRPSVRP